MTYGSLSTNQFQFGHDAGAYLGSTSDALALHHNENVKQSTFNTTYHAGYDRYLAPDDFSQSSSEDSCSQSSDSTIPTSPLSNPSDDIADKTYKDVADLSLCSSQEDNSPSTSKIAVKQQPRCEWQKNNSSLWKDVNK